MLREAGEEGRAAASLCSVCSFMSVSGVETRSRTHPQASSFGSELLLSNTPGQSHLLALFVPPRRELGVRILVVDGETANHEAGQALAQPAPKPARHRGRTGTAAASSPSRSSSKL